MQKSETPFAQMNKRPVWAGVVIGAALVCAGAVGLAYFWRVMFNLGELPMLPVALGVAGVCLLVFALFVVAWRWAKDKLCFKASLAVFICGLLFVFATAPFQVPDEEAHYLRSYEIAHGGLQSNYERQYSGDAAWLVHSMETTAGMGHAVKYEEGELAPAHIAAYLQGVASGEEIAPVSAPIAKMLLPYLPQALGMLVARLFGFEALGLLYAARMGNLLFYAVMSYFTFRNCQRYRGVFFALVFLPLSLVLAASCSYDATMLAVCYFLVSYFCKAEVREQALVFFCLGAAYVTFLKPLNIFLVPILLLIPKTRWKSRWNPWAVTGLIFGAALLVYWLAGKFADGVLALNYPAAAELPRGGNTEEVVPKEQLFFIFSNPFAFAARMLWSVFESAGFVFNLGLLGKLDVDLPLISGMSVASMFAASALGIQQKEDTKKGAAVALGLAAVLYAAAVLAGMYVLDSSVYSARITGVQPRYFLPAILLAFMLLSILLGKAVRPRIYAGTAARTESITLYIAVAVALVAAIVLFQSYFIGQWLPKGEGGYKMVNLLGWQVY